MARKKQVEKKVSYAVAKYLALKHPKVIFRFDVAADLKLPKRIAAIIKNKLLHKRGHHDLTIFDCRGGYGGLCLELKKDANEVFKKDGKIREEKHIQEQYKHILNMRSKGYCADFSLGLDDTIKKIDNYFKLKPSLKNFNY